jgi:hypothetical protein
MDVPKGNPRFDAHSERVPADISVTADTSRERRDCAGVSRRNGAAKTHFPLEPGRGLDVVEALPDASVRPRCDAGPSTGELNLRLLSGVYGKRPIFCGNCRLKGKVSSGTDIDNVFLHRVETFRRGLLFLPV